MGITGLLPLLKPVTKDSNISSYRNKTIAIDGYAWLHKAVYSCCMELALGQESDLWMSYCLNLIDMLLFNRITVYMVFDGANLPAKNITENTRARKRSEALAAALLHQQSDKKDDREKARGFFAKAVDVTPRMAGQLIKVLRKSRPKVILFNAFYNFSYVLVLSLLDNETNSPTGFVYCGAL